MKSALAIAAASFAATAFAAANTASAAIIHHSELPNGVASVNMSKDSMAIGVSTNLRTFQSKTTNGTTGTGVKGGNVNGEIDSSETITFIFAQPVFITGLQIGQLYTDGNFGDINDEAAQFDTDAGSFTIVADTATSATWNGFGNATNISPGHQQGGGEWRIQGANIFGAPITELTLRSGTPGGNATFGDYTFVELSYTAVPTPGTIALASLGGLMMLRRRRNA
jgi:hypothetical protein